MKFLPSIQEDKQEVAGKSAMCIQTPLENQGPVVQSIVSLTSSLKGHFVNYFSGFNIQYSDIFCWKMWMQKPLTFFQQNIAAYLHITRCKF